MNILIITGIFPPDIGGPATYVPQIARGLAEQGHKITVLTLSDRTSDAQHLKPDTQYPFQVVRLSRRAFKPWRWVWTVRAILSLGRDRDLLFVNGLAIEAVLANLALKKPMVQKIVGDLAWERATNKGWTSDDFETFQTTRYNRRATSYGLRIELLKSLRAWWTKRADKVLVPSRYLARWVASWGVPEGKIVVVYNAVEPPNGIQAAHLPLQSLMKVITVGRLVPWKLVDHVIEAAARCDGVGLIIVGDGPERGRLEGLANRLKVASRVYFAGQRSTEEAVSIMAACDVFVLNSTYEGFPHVVLEAMSLGLPVVATAAGGTPEVVKDGQNGRLVAPGDDDGLCRILASLVHAGSERKRLGDGGRQTVKHFSTQEMLNQTEALLQSSALAAKS